MKGAAILGLLVLGGCAAEVRRGRATDVEGTRPLVAAPAPAVGAPAWPSSLEWPEPLAPVPGTWIRIPRGTFTMGAADDEPCNRSTHAGLHTVTLTRDYEIGDAEVTQADHREVTGESPSTFADCGADCPVELMSWHRAAAYCDALSDLAGLPSCYDCSGSGEETRCAPTAHPYECAGYRLPTEAEWERAYRAGGDTPIHNGTLVDCSSLDPGLARIAWFLFNAGGRTHPVRSLEPNAWGLFDMSGNVWEWTHDGYRVLDGSPQIDPAGAATPEDLRVMRGGSYNCVPEETRAAHRSGLPATIAGSNVGMRCARTLGP